jgi:Transmembrane amino acid transporter protein
MMVDKVVQISATSIPSRDAGDGDNGNDDVYQNVTMSLDHEDPLFTSDTSSIQQQDEIHQHHHHHHHHHHQLHLKTYTVGEDKGRLAAAAKELGLSKSRKPRRQVRQQQQQSNWNHALPGVRRRGGTGGGNRSNLHNHQGGFFVQNVWHLLLESTTEDATMLATYSAHNTVTNSNTYCNPTMPSPFLQRNHPLVPLTEYNNLDDDIKIEGDVRHRRNNHKSNGDNEANYTFSEVDSDDGDDVDQQQQQQSQHVEEIDGNGDLTSAVLATIRGMVGPAILYLPHGFANAGYLVAAPLLFLCTFFFLYSSQCLLDAWKYEHDNDNRKETQSNTEAPDNNDSSGGNNTEPSHENFERSPLISASTSSSFQPDHQSTKTSQDTNNNSDILSYPELAYRALGPIGETIVKVGIACMQSGVCLTYLIFVPYNLHTSVLYVFKVNIQPTYWLVLMILIQIPLSWIRDIRKLTPTNLVANVLILYGLSVCMGYAILRVVEYPTASSSTNNKHDNGVTSMFHNLWNNLTHLPPYAPNWILFIGTSVRPTIIV